MLHLLFKKTAKSLHLTSAILLLVLWMFPQGALAKEGVNEVLNHVGYEIFIHVRGDDPGNDTVFYSYLSEIDQGNRTFIKKILIFRGDELTVFLSENDDPALAENFGVKFHNVVLTLNIDEMLANIQSSTFGQAVIVMLDNRVTGDLASLALPVKHRDKGKHFVFRRDPGDGTVEFTTDREREHPARARRVLLNRFGQ